jgi:hypothetical protein
MYYNNNDKILIRRLPKNIIKPDATLFIDFDQSDIDTLSDYGYFTIRNDSIMPEDCEREDIDKRSITLDKPYVDIHREWIKKPKEATDVL